MSDDETHQPATEQIVDEVIRRHTKRLISTAEDALRAYQPVTTIEEAEALARHHLAELRRGMSPKITVGDTVTINRPGGPSRKFRVTEATEFVDEEDMPTGEWQFVGDRIDEEPDDA